MKFQIVCQERKVNSIRELINKLDSILNKEYNDVVVHALREHIEKQVPLTDSIFRSGSQAFVELFAEAKKQRRAGILPQLDEDSEELLLTDIGEWDYYQGVRVPLDAPIELVTESEYRGKKVELNKPKRGGSKAYYVYVKNPDTGNVIKVEFGSGMRAKVNDPEARKRYNDRHGCSKGRHNDKTKAGYWSCRLPRYAKSLGLSGGGQWW